MAKILKNASVLAMAVATMGAAPAFAQQAGDAVVVPDTEPPQSGGLDEIVVTARKVSENLQDVPVAITALSGDALEQNNVVRVQDLGRLAPGLTMRAGTSQASAVNIQLRGQYQNEVLAALDPSVGTYVDGYYWARAFGLNADMLDVQSVQVLRGPQGTLFGRNTTGGALILQTNDPDTRNLSGLLSGTYGRFDEKSVTAVLNLPIVENKIALRVAGNFMDRDGYVLSSPFTYNGATVPTALIKTYPFASPGVLDNKPTAAGSVGRKLGDRGNYTLRAKLLIQPTENFSLLFSAEQFRFASFAQNYRLAVVDTRPGTRTNAEAGLELGAAPADAEAAGRAFFAAYIPSAQNGDRVSLNEDPAFYTKTRTYLGTANLDTGFGAVKLITGYRRVQARNNNDLDGSPIYVLDTAGSQDLDQFSAELQVTGKAFDNRLEFAAGAFYFEEAGYDQSTSITLPRLSTLATGPAGVNESFVYGEIDNVSKGVYGQATFHLNDRLSFTGGLRYSAEKKGITVYNRTLNRLTGALVNCSLTGADPTSLPQPCRFGRSDDFSAVTYLAGLNYQAAEDTLVYIKTSKGFRSGGQQQRATGGSGGFVPFDPEFSREHELGLKTELFDRRLRVNVAAFLNNVTGLQRSRSLVFEEGGQLRTTTIIGNAGKSRTYGGELEVTAAVTDGFTINATAAYIKPKYIDYFTPRGTTGQFYDRRGERFDQVPRWQWSLGGNYEHDLSWGKLNFNASFSWQDTTPIRDVNFIFDTAAGLARDIATDAVYTIETGHKILEATTQKAGGQLDLRATLTLLDGNVDLAVWGRNVTNFRPVVSSLVFNAPLAAVVNQKRDPAMYGLTFTYRFGN